MRKTPIGTKSKIVEPDRLCDSIDITLRDIIVKDLLSDTEKKTYYDEKKREQFNKFDIYVDKYEADPKVVFNFSVDDEPACKEYSSFEMYTVSGNNNETGNDPVKIDGQVLSTAPDSIVEFKMPLEEKDNTFSFHSNGYGYANYVIYAVGSNLRKTVLAKGKIYMTDVLFDLTESILDGQ